MNVLLDKDEAVEITYPEIADVEDIQAEPEPEDLPKDPEPKRKPSKTPRQSRTRVTAAVKKDVEAKIAMMVGLPAAMLTPYDPICFGALTDVTPELAKALTDLAVQSPDLVAWFTSSGKFMTWFSIAMILQPVAVAAYKHHVTHELGEHANEGLPDGYAYAAPPI